MTIERESLVDMRSLKKLLRLLNEFVPHMEKAQEKIYEKYTKETKKEFDYIARTAIDHFYESYPEPNIYNRQFRLYNSVKVNVTNKSWDLLYDVEQTKDYGRLSSYIYHYVLEEGYHGGADKTSNSNYPHPQPGIPWWKYPPEYLEWKSPALKTQSPLKEIEEREKEWMEGVGDKMQTDYNNLLKPKLDEIVNQTKLTIRG